MKILSIITVGGHYIKWLIASLILMLSLQSCDVAYTLPLDNNRFSYDIYFPGEDYVKTSCMYFRRFHYLNFDLKGAYVVNLDSLKLSIKGNNMKIIGLDTSLKNNYHVKNRLVGVRLFCEVKDISQEYKQPSVLYVLPSNFIMRDSQRVLVDTMKFVLQRPGDKHH